MRNAGLEETQAGIKIAGRNINNLRYEDHLWCNQYTMYFLEKKKRIVINVFMFPRWFSDKGSAYQAEDLDLISGSRRSPGEGNGNPLQHSCLENPMDGGA